MKAETKVAAGSQFPTIAVRGLDGKIVDISKPTGDADWKMIVVYRGRHCEQCTGYLNKLQGFMRRLGKIGIEPVAVSGDSKEQLEDHLRQLEVTYSIKYGLTVEQMRQLGLYVSPPRSTHAEDHPFPEPGLFVINERNQVQVVNISNNPFVQPDLDELTSGLERIKNPEDDYPIRGSYR